MVVGVSYVAAQELTSSGSDEVSLAQAEEGAPPADTPGQGPKRHRLGRFHGAIRGEVVVPGEVTSSVRFASTAGSSSRWTARRS